MKNKCGRNKSLKMFYLMRRNPLRKELDSNCFLWVHKMKHKRNSIFQSKKIRKYYWGSRKFVG